jgi:ArsR family transcriptional regulator, arsenate/arsenite/antimonite-responsive transcriptional repressor
MERWTNVFRVLANINRLKIIALLSVNDRLNVTELTGQVHISFKATANHLAILKNSGVLSTQGTGGHVYYHKNPKMPDDFRKAIKLYLK